jgi:hypothetical protein
MLCLINCFLHQCSIPLQWCPSSASHLGMQQIPLRSSFLHFTGLLTLSWTEPTDHANSSRAVTAGEIFSVFDIAGLTFAFRSRGPGIAYCHPLQISAADPTPFASLHRAFLSTAVIERMITPWCSHLRVGLLESRLSLRNRIPRGRKRASMSIKTKCWQSGSKQRGIRVDSKS